MSGKTQVDGLRGVSQGQFSVTLLGVKSFDTDERRREEATVSMPARRGAPSPFSTGRRAVDLLEQGIGHVGDVFAALFARVAHPSPAPAAKSTPRPRTAAEVDRAPNVDHRRKFDQVDWGELQTSLADDSPSPELSKLFGRHDFHQ